jgi:hypothetical protein
LVEADEAALDFVKDGGGWPGEGSLDVLLVFGGGFYVEHFVVSSQLEGFVAGDHAFLYHVALVAHQYQNDIFVAVVLDVLDPARHVAEGVLAGEIEDHKCGG